MAREVVLVDAVRTPIGKRNGGLSSVHSIDLFATALTGLLDRVAIDPAEVGQVVGGCVGQVGMQSLNVTRTAWLTSGLPHTVPATTIDTQCGSGQQALTFGVGLIGAGLTDVAVVGGVENMSRVPMGSQIPRDPNAGKPVNRGYFAHYEYTSQFEGAERVAERWGITRSDCDEFAKLSQDRAAAAWADGRFDAQLVPVETAELDEDGKPTGSTRRIVRDEGLRETTLEGLASLRPTGRPDGVHTAGSSSQIADGASAALLMSAERAASLGLEPLATIVDTCLVGCDPVVMLEGPIPATRRILAANGLSLDDLDVVEVNEAFAAVVLAWQRELETDLERVNPNGGAIAIGHPLGATGTMLIAKAAHELARTGGEHALVTMCCNGGLGTATLLRRA